MRTTVATRELNDTRPGDESDPQPAHTQSLECCRSRRDGEQTAGKGANEHSRPATSPSWIALSTAARTRATVDVPSHRCYPTVARLASGANLKATARRRPDALPHELRYRPDRPSTSSPGSRDCLFSRWAHQGDRKGDQLNHHGNAVLAADDEAGAPGAAPAFGRHSSARCG